VKLLLINPNTSSHVTDRMVTQARRTAGSRAAVDGVTAAFGPAIIGSKAENAIAAHGALDTAARHYAGYDAIILGVSMDSGLAALRELFPIPVVGMAEASILFACSLGARVGCFTLGPKLLPLYQSLTDSYGFSERVACWRALDLPAAYGTEMLPEVADAVADACERMARNDGVDIAVLCGAVLTGYAERIAGLTSIPVVDCIDAATRTAIMLVERDAVLAGKASTRALVRGRRSVGLGQELAALLQG
jgi:allantoin racemase